MGTSDPRGQQRSLELLLYGCALQNGPAAGPRSLKSAHRAPVEARSRPQQAFRERLGVSKNQGLQIWTPNSKALTIIKDIHTKDPYFLGNAHLRLLSVIFFCTAPFLADVAQEHGHPNKA